MVNWNAARLLETAAQAQPGSGPELLMDIAENIAIFAGEVKESLERIETLLKTPVSEERKVTNGSRPEAIIRRVRVTSSGTATQGPDVMVPEGVATVIRQRRHTTSPNGRIALNERDVSSTGSRIETVNGDTVVLVITNWNKIWFDSDADDTDFELIAEQ